MALETRNSAIYKRAEQLRRWEDSDTNRERILRKTKSPRVKFSASCVFLAACRAGDKDEVLKLLEKGTDINTANVDGLTALHQASIEDNLDMVEFLVQNGANVNLGDNEGWTPLHATASCGFCSIAKYLIEHGADVAAINNERELPIDLAESDDMSDILREEIQKRGIDCETARGNEERCMIEDAKQWASGDCNENIDNPDHKTGATILHIAAAKGYIEVMQILLDNGLVDVDKQDYDGWTPLHAAAHWGQREAARLLVDNLADMEIENFYRQTPFDVADPDMLEFLENLKVKQSSLNKEIILGKRQAKQKSNSPAKIKKVDLQIEKDKEVNEDENGTMDNNIEKKNRVNAGVTPPSPTEPSRIFPPSPVSPPSPTTTTANEQNSISRTANQAPTITPKAPPTTDSNQDESGTIPSWRRPASFRTRLGNDSPTKSLALRIGEKETKSPTSPTSRLETDVVLRRTHSFENDEKFKLRYMELQERIKKASSLYPIPSSPENNPHSKLITRFGTLPTLQKKTDTTNNNNNEDLTNNCSLTDAIDFRLTKILPNPLTRSSSLRTDRWLSNNFSKDPSITSSSPVTTPTVTISTANTSPNRTSSSPTATSPQPNNQMRSIVHKKPPVGAPVGTPVGGSLPVTIVTPATPPTPTPVTTPTPTTPTNTGNKLSPGNIFKNFFKSFVPPVRDEESETQRKAHAKRVRETRRSTQGVTLDEIKSAEQIIKQKNQPNSIDQPSIETSTTTSSTNGESPTNGSVPTVTATITTGTPTVVSRDPEDQQNNVLHERRPSWRLRVDNGSKFKLEDAGTNTTGTPTVFARRTGSTQSLNVRPSSAPVESTTNVPPSPPVDAVITLPLRRNSKPLEDKDQDKENDVRNAQATQAVIQRRKRPKRRSTGVVHVDMDEIDPDNKQDSNAGGDCDDAKLNHQESGSEQGSGTRRLVENNSTPLIRDENGEIDYKKLWEQSQAENERLRDKLRKQDDELRDTKTTLEKISTVTSKNSLSELEKREKRAMERKLSEMEEELKQLEALKVENQRLKDENGALIRVISKLSK